MLTDRQRKVLLSVIQDYIVTAEPVGSRNVARRYMTNVSPATIRNEMADLEEMGYLYQPYTSAGRVPTNKAYRFYVNYLLERMNISNFGNEIIKSELRKQTMEINTLLHKVAKLLSESTDYLGLVLSPLLKEAILEKIRLVPLDSRHIMLVIVSRRNGVISRVIDLSSPFGRQDIEEIESFLNMHLAGKDIEYVEDFKKRMLGLIDEKLRDCVSLLNSMATAMDDMSYYFTEEKLYWMGINNILRLPEFHNVERIKLILKVLEEEDRLEQVLVEDIKREGIKIRIGEENIIDEIKECTLVTDNYYIDGRLVGVVGVLGPTRMDYGKVITIIEKVARELSEMEQ